MPVLLEGQTIITLLTDKSGYDFSAWKDSDDRWYVTPDKYSSCKKGSLASGFRNMDDVNKFRKFSILNDWAKDWFVAKLAFESGWNAQVFDLERNLVCTIHLEPCSYFDLNFKDRLPTQFAVMGGYPIWHLAQCSTGVNKILSNGEYWNNKNSPYDSYYLVGRDTLFSRHRVDYVIFLCRDKAQNSLYYLINHFSDELFDLKIQTRVGLIENYKRAARARSQTNLYVPQ